MKPIKLFWWRTKNTPVNFGDTLNPLIVQHIAGREVEHSSYSKCDMLAIGSLLDKATRRSWRWALHHPMRKLPIWGTGSFGKARNGDRMQFHAVRGPLTRQMLKLEKHVAIGDPALLLSQMLSKQQKRHRWGLIPHYAHVDHPLIKEYARTLNAMIIDVRDPDVLETARQIGRCDFILSSSLHGIIVADALSVPNVWLNPAPNAGDAYKFHDYFASVDRDIRSLLEVIPSTDLETMAMHASPDIIERICGDLKACFPL